MTYFLINKLDNGRKCILKIMTLINQSTLIKKFYIKKKVSGFYIYRATASRKAETSFQLDKETESNLYNKYLTQKNKFMHALITDSSIKTSLRNNSTIFIYSDKLKH